MRSLCNGNNEGFFESHSLSINNERSQLLRVCKNYRIYCNYVPIFSSHSVLSLDGRSVSGTRRQCDKESTEMIWEVKERPYPRSSKICYFLSFIRIKFCLFCTYIFWNYSKMLLSFLFLGLIIMPFATYFFPNHSLNFLDYCLSLRTFCSSFMSLSLIFSLRDSLSSVYPCILLLFSLCILYLWESRMIW